MHKKSFKDSPQHGKKPLSGDPKTDDTPKVSPRPEKTEFFEKAKQIADEIAELQAKQKDSDLDLLLSYRNLCQDFDDWQSPDKEPKKVVEHLRNPSKQSESNHADSTQNSKVPAKFKGQQIRDGPTSDTAQISNISNIPGLGLLKARAGNPEEAFEDAIKLQNRKKEDQYPNKDVMRPEIRAKQDHEARAKQVIKQAKEKPLARHSHADASNIGDARGYVPAYRRVSAESVPARASLEVPRMQNMDLMDPLAEER